MPLLKRMIREFTLMGGDEAVLHDPEVAHLAIESNRVLSSRVVKGLSVKSREHAGGVDLDIELATGAALSRPVHMCFGVMGREGTQRLGINLKMGRNARADFIAHCIFPTGTKVLHEMDADVELSEGAQMTYNEAHFHGHDGGVTVQALSRVSLGTGASYRADFSLLDGLVGRLNIDYSVQAGDDTLTELGARVFGHYKDIITITENVSLMGARARSLIKTRVALEGEAEAEIRGITEGHAPYARGHVDCTEIVRDKARASAVPLVRVTDPLAKVTHEAAIGSVDKGQMETLCARGLRPEQAVDVIVKGMLGPALSGARAGGSIQ